VCLKFGAKKGVEGGEGEKVAPNRALVRHSCPEKREKASYRKGVETVQRRKGKGEGARHSIGCQGKKGREGGWSSVGEKIKTFYHSGEGREEKVEGKTQGWTRTQQIRFSPRKWEKNQKTLRERENS